MATDIRIFEAWLADDNLPADRKAKIAEALDRLKAIRERIDDKKFEDWKAKQDRSALFEQWAFESVIGKMMSYEDFLRTMRARGLEEYSFEDVSVFVEFVGRSTTKHVGRTTKLMRAYISVDEYMCSVSFRLIDDSWNGLNSYRVVTNAAKIARFGFDKWLAAQEAMSRRYGDV